MYVLELYTQKNAYKPKKFKSEAYKIIYKRKYVHKTVSNSIDCN